MSETPAAAQYRQLQNAATQMLDAADTAARNGDTTAEHLAEQAAGRLLNQAAQVGKPA